MAARATYVPLADRNVNTHRAVAAVVILRWIICPISALRLIPMRIDKAAETIRDRPILSKRMVRWGDLPKDAD
jgi:hypothetical protein